MSSRINRVTGACLGWLSLALCTLPAGGQSSPRPPCGQQSVPPYPSYPSLSDQPLITFWNQSSGRRDWKPPACTPWDGARFSTLVTAVAHFRGPAKSEELLRRI